MANIRVIKRRIRSVQSTAKITKAMEMIATSKMRRTQQRAVMARPYAEKMREVLADLAATRQEGESLHPLLQRRPVKKIAIIHFTADRGLCGGLNANMNRRAGSFILGQSAPVTLVTVGRKGRDFMVRYGRELRAEFTGLSDQASMADTLPISRIVIEDYAAGLVDQVYLAYTRFMSTMVQRPVLEELLPIEPPAGREGKGEREYIYEPSAAVVLDALLPRFVEMQVYHAFLESVASEQSARMVAMRSATDNALDMVQDLTLVYNKARQDMITKELLDIAGGAAAQAQE
ncbi:MAG: ATP synthase F1 subunit gamma [Chloroflexota bacterium]|nr:ATP synthase F1 subunit gamma [Chloroflexota bacterium]